MYRWVSRAWFILAKFLVVSVSAFTGNSMGIRPPWTVKNLREIARIHYLRDCVPSRPIFCWFKRRVKSAGMTNQNSYVPAKKITIDVRYYAYVLFSRNEISNYEFCIFFYNGTFKKLRSYCTRWIWKKKKNQFCTCAGIQGGIYQFSWKIYFILYIFFINTGNYVKLK